MKFLKIFKSPMKHEIDINKIDVIPPKMQPMTCFVSKPIKLKGNREYLLVADYKKRTMELYRKIGTLKEGDS